MTTTRMTMAQALVRFLTKQYVERDGQRQRLFAGIFGIFGHGNVSGLGQALEEVGRDLRYYQPRNEQAMVHTAAAYAKMKNRLQTFACTSSIGPGATNMVTGASGATVNRLPVLLLPGDIFANRKPHPVLQQLEFGGSQDVSVNDCFRPVSKYWDRINRPEQIMSSLPEAMRILTDPAETGAVTICLPEDVQTEAYDYPNNLFEERTHRIPRTVPPESELSVAVGMIRDARCPLIIAGGGVIYSEASQALDTIATNLRVPVCETQAGKGSLPWDHAWQVGPLGTNGGLAANRLAAQADLVITVGTRMTDFTTASRTAFQNPDVRFLSVNVSSMDAHKLGAFPLIGDARATLQALALALEEAGYRSDEGYARRVTELKREWDDAVDRQRQVAGSGPLTQANVIGLVNANTRKGDVMVCAAGGLPGDLLKLWRTEDPKGYHLEYGYSCMGYEIAGGLGVKMADPGREVYVMVGDGSYLMLSNEIVTSVQEGYKLTIVLVDNHGFQCIRGLQQSTGSPAFGNELRYRDTATGRLEGPYVPVDFIKNAESLGAKTYFADSAVALERALAAASRETRTALIYVPVDVDARVPAFEGWWDVPVAQVSGEAGVQKASQDYDEAVKKERLYY
jgi:3D-(3,5/4)-trihydroxycyclohexane-1,2-dione acylhydrolase (decyclizing)